MTIPKSLEALSPWLEDAWLERYLNRETTADETAWFEAYMLEHPHVADALETDAAIAAVLSQQTPQSIQLRVAVNRETPAPRPNTRRRWSQPGWMGVAAAAALTLALTSPFLLHQDGPDSMQANRVLVDTVRSADANASVLTVRDNAGAKWTLLEINTAARSSDHEVRVNDRPLGTFRSDDEGVLHVLAQVELGELKQDSITAIKLDNLHAVPVSVTSTVDLSVPKPETQNLVCRGASQLRTTSDPARFITVGSGMANYIDILHVRNDDTPGNPCATTRQGWTADEYIFICQASVNKQQRLFAHIRRDTAVNFNCADGNPVTLSEQDGQYSSAYWDDFARGFRYYVLLEWDQNKCQTAGCEPYFIESFDLNALAVNACFNHQPSIEVPTAQACANRPLSKQSEDGGGEKPP